MARLQVVQPPSSLGDLIFYDGVCGLCNRLVQFVLRHDRAHRFRFATLQGELAERILGEHGQRASNLDTVYVLPAGGPLLCRARAIFYILGQFGGLWKLTRAAALLPTPLLDFGYRLVARVRYRLFGKLDRCAIPSPEERAQFLD